jgi:isoleucyl-tRNA synthetase
MCHNSEDYDQKFLYMPFLMITGKSLEGANYIHPCRSEQVQPFLPAAYVTTSKGTGLVHSAPAHGPEDFLVALEHSMHIVSGLADIRRFVIQGIS